MYIIHLLGPECYFVLGKVKCNTNSGPEEIQTYFWRD